MTDLIEVATKDLVGEQLAWAAGKADGQDVLLEPPQYGNPWRVFVRFTREATVRVERYEPQCDWAWGGPLIEKYGCDLYCAAVMAWEANCWDETSANQDLHLQEADTPLVAACRTIVSAKLGASVYVPKELTSCPI